jgi:hypothetical protein
VGIAEFEQLAAAGRNGHCDHAINPTRRGRLIIRAI